MASIFTSQSAFLCVARIPVTDFPTARKYSLGFLSGGESKGVVGGSKKRDEPEGWI